MKIALVVPGGVDRSGTHRVIPALLALIRRLSRHHEVHVFAVSQEDESGRWQLAGARIHNIAKRGRLSKGIAAVIAENRLRAFDVVHAIWSGKCGFIAVAAAKLLGRPCLVHVAGGELAAIPSIRYGGALRLKGRLSERVILRNASAVTAASAPILASIRKLGVEARRVPLGVDLDTWPCVAPVRRGAGPSRLIHVASLNRVKDHATLLHALAILKANGRAFELRVVGEDILQGRTQALAAQLGLQDRVSFLGFRTRAELHPLVATAHINVITSRHEAGPLAVLEAAVVGVPTVGTAVGHIAEWFPHAAVATPVGDSAALAMALAALLDDEERRLTLAAAAQALALAEDADFTAARFEQLYRAVARES